jgi:hypothetical protein
LFLSGPIHANDAHPVGGTQFLHDRLKLLEVRKFMSIWCRIEEIVNGASVPEEERSKFEAKLSLFRWRGVAVVAATILLFLALCGACVTLIGMGRCPGGIHTWHGCLHIEVDVPANSS